MMPKTRIADLEAALRRMCDYIEWLETKEGPRPFEVDVDPLEWGRAHLSPRQMRADNVCAICHEPIKFWVERAETSDGVYHGKCYEAACGVKNTPEAATHVCSDDPAATADLPRAAEQVRGDNTVVGAGYCCSEAHDLRSDVIGEACPEAETKARGNDGP